MPSWKRVLHRLLYPGKILSCLISLSGFSLLAAVFYKGWTDTPLAYISYIFAFYCLILDCILLTRHAKTICQRIRQKKPGHLRRSLLKSLAINVLYSTFLLISGFYYHSIWFISSGIYYLVLSVIRLQLTRFERRASACADTTEKLLVGWNGFLCCGICMFFLNFAMAGMAVQLVWFGQGGRYHEIMVYAIATYTFYRFTMSIVHVVQQRKARDPLLGAVRNISLSAAMMSLYSLQVTMLNVFSGEQAPSFLLNTLTGTAVCLLVILGALGMTLHAFKQKKALSSADPSAQI